MKKHHNRGGKRTGAGRPEHDVPVKAKSFRLPLDVCDKIEEQPNQTEYVAGLVRGDNPQTAESVMADMVARNLVRKCGTSGHDRAVIAYLDARVRFTGSMSGHEWEFKDGSTLTLKDGKLTACPF